LQLDGDGVGAEIVEGEVEWRDAGEEVVDLGGLIEVQLVSGIGEVAKILTGVVNAVGHEAVDGGDEFAVGQRLVRPGDALREFEGFQGGNPLECADAHPKRRGWCDQQLGKLDERALDARGEEEDLLAEPFQIGGQIAWVGWFCASRDGELQTEDGIVHALPQVVDLALGLDSGEIGCGAGRLDDGLDDGHRTNINGIC